MAEDTGLLAPWSRRKRDTVTVIWASLLGALAASVIFFGLFDPGQLSLIASVPLPSDRVTGYTLFFLVFWIVCAFTAALAIYLLRSYQDGQQ